VVLANAADPSRTGTSDGAVTLQIVLGAGLLVAAVHRLRRRPAPGEVAPVPAWMTGIAGFTPGKSLGIGAAIGAANPKNIAVGIAGAVVISTAHPRPAGRWWPVPSTSSSPGSASPPPWW